jgi:NAD+ synthase
MTHKLCLAIVQANPTVGDIAGNLALAKSHTLAQKDADLVVFSECFFTGYPIEDLVRRPGFRALTRAAIDDFSHFVCTLDGPTVIVGAPVDGLDLPYNAGLMFHPDGTIRATYKRDLPNSDVFDEVRVFAPGTVSRPMPLGDFRIGLGVCEEMWHPAVAADLSGELASVLVFINGSPFEEGKQTLREDIARRRVSETGLPLVYVNQVGGQDELVFDGASFVMNRMGHIVARLPAFQDGVLRISLQSDGEGHFDIEPDQAYGAVTQYPDRLAAIYAGATLALRDYVNKNGFPGVIFGLSGGLDSALVAAISADALGPDHVHCRMLPSGYTSGESVTDAAECAALIGLHHGTISIAPAVAAFTAMLADEFAGTDQGVTEENIQARARGVTIMALSNKHGWMPLATGNKSEMSVGYATLYADMCGGYAVLKDIYKTDVFALCEWRNAHRPFDALGPEGRVIPQRIITKPPTAELSPGQSDEQALGPYDELDAVLRCLIERDLDSEAAARTASRLLKKPISTAYVVRIARLVKNAEFKRRQSAPGVKLTSRPFGKGWRYPITSKAAL